VDHGRLVHAGDVAEPVREFDYLLLRLETPTERDDLDRISAIFDFVEKAEEIAADALEPARRLITAAKLAARHSHDLTAVDRKRVPIAIEQRFRDFIEDEGIAGGGARSSFRPVRGAAASAGPRLQRTSRRAPGDRASRTASVRSP
jgi:hypothetical protein